MRDSTEALIALMKQEDGVTKFQYVSIVDGKWCDCSFPTAPCWGMQNTFRVKPKPIEGWAWKYPSGPLGSIAHLYNQKQPDDISGSGCVMVLMREVTE